MDDDDLGDQGKKTNASPVHKPEHGKQYDVAPKGSVGRAPGGLPSLGLGSSNTGRQTVQQTDGQSLDQGQEADKKIVFRQNPEQSQAKDDRPIAEKTDDDVVNKLSEEQGFQLKTIDEIKKLAHPEKEKADDTPERSGDQFRETDNQEVNEFYQKTDDMVSREEAIKKRAAEIKKSFENQKSRDRDRSR